MFRRLLVANRGEIACRVMRSARALGLTTIAVYSSADRRARHVALADEAYYLGPPAPRDSYLNGAAVLAAARAARVDAIHPGYGFLAEDAEFAAAVVAAGLVFVGPSAEAIRAMGSKDRAKRIMAKAGVALLPGYHEPDQDDNTLLAAAGKLGFPLLIKAAAGGGGKGMRIVAQQSEFPAALQAARRESQAAFGDDTVILERYLTAPRHIEVQIFGDNHGHLVSLAERDCSVQRRYQKVLEEAPAPGVTEQQRAALCDAALKAAAAIGYVGAGTVEFIEQDGVFAFMEMNTRLQVEHPVTELVLGVDLVEWQLRVAAGEALPQTQDQIAPRGHAVEARVYAEDPAAGFLPATGVIRHLSFPQGRNVRVDTGVAVGDEISPYYDPLIAKLVAWGEDRGAAFATLLAALSRCEIVGVTTNLQLLAALAGHPDLTAGPVDTGFIARNPALLRPQRLGDSGLVLAALALLLQQQSAARRLAVQAHEPNSPWLLMDGFRANRQLAAHLSLTNSDGDLCHVTLVNTGSQFTAIVNDTTIDAVAALQGNELTGRLGTQPFKVTVLIDAGEIHVVRGVVTERYGIPGYGGQADELALGSLTSPMPGQVIEIKVAVGDQVAAGETLLIVEAMKMEHAIKAPSAGIVTQIHCQTGGRVREGVALVRLEQRS